MAERGHRTSMDGSLESPSDASPVVKTKYGNVHVKSSPLTASLSVVKSGTVSDQSSPVAHATRTTPPSSKRGSLDDGSKAVKQTTSADPPPAGGFSRERRPLSWHYKEQGSPVSTITSNPPGKLRGGFPKSSPPADADAKDSPPAAQPVASPMSLLAHRRQPRRATVHHTSEQLKELHTSPPTLSTNRNRRQSELPPFVSRGSSTNNPARSLKAGGMDVADLDDYNLLMDISSSPGRNQAEQKELLSKEEARRKNAASFNQQVKEQHAEKTKRMKDVKGRALQKLAAMRRMAAMRGAGPVDVLNFKKEPISATNSNLECGIAIRPGERAATVVAFSPSGHLLATSGADGVIRVFDTVRYKQQRALTTHMNWVMALAWSPDGGNLVSTSDDKSIVVWSTKTWEPLHTIQGNNSAVRCCCFSPDGASLIASSPDSSSALKVYDAKTWAVVEEMAGHGDMIRCAAFHPDGSMLATGADDNVVKVWHTSLWTLVRSLESRGHTAAVMCCAFNDAGTVLVSGSADKSVIVWDSHSWAPMQVLSGHADAVLCVAFAPASNVLASGSSDGEIKLWDTGNWRTVRTLTGHKDFVQGLTFHPNGKLLVSASFDKSVRCWV